MLKKRLLLCFQLRNRLGLFTRDLLPFFFDPLYSFFDPCQPERDFLLLLLQFFESDDFIALASEEVAIRSVFPHEIDTWDPYEGEVRVWKAEGARA